MADIQETRLPGVGTKFTMDTHHQGKVCSVVHVDGMREVYFWDGVDEDEEPTTIVLSDSEARQLGAILGGVVYRPQLVQDLEVALKDLVMEWIELGPDSPLVGLTVATCRIRSTTGATIVAILRDSGSLATPHPEEELRDGDVLVVIGRPETFADIRRIVDEGPEA